MGPQLPAQLGAVWPPRYNPVWIQPPLAEALPGLNPAG